MSVLLVTRSDDNAAVDLVASALAHRGEVSIRLDTDRYPEHLGISTAYSAGTCRRTLTLGDQQIDLGEVTASWYRRFYAGGALPASLGDTREACVQESRRTLYGTIASLGCFELDPLVAVREADHKELQLRRAAACGLCVPATLFSNEPAAVRSFYEEVGGRMITKMQSSFAIYRDGVENVVFTNIVQRADLDGLEGLRYAPMIFQEHLDKEFELRVTLIGRQAFAASIDSQRRQQTAIDWRRDGVGLLEEWRPYALPKEVERGLLQLTEAFGLNYAAADIVVTKDGRHVFLELNAGGEWLWLARSPGLAIAEALADTLLGKVPRVGPRKYGPLAFAIGAAKET